uniref:Uncharacterized protein n=1 Tax=Rhizophora mucronata TaxID=61149 RepID=A0A2P2MW56_RHIMU
MIFLWWEIRGYDEDSQLPLLNVLLKRSAGRIEPMTFNSHH